MRLLRNRSRLRWLAAALGAAVLLATAATAGAVVPPVVSLTLGAGHAKRTLPCPAGNNDPYAVFARGSRVVIAGSVRPKPSARPWRVTVRVKRCVAGHFHSIWKRLVVGRPDGSFTVVYSTRVPGLYFARASYRRKPAIESPKQRFAVR